MSNIIKEPFGTLPVGFKYIDVGSNVDFLTGPAFDSSRFNDNGIGLRLARGINITRGKMRWDKKNTQFWDGNNGSLKKYELAEADILIGMDGSLVGRNYASIRSEDLPCLLVQRVARLRKHSLIDMSYLYFTIASDYWLNYVDVVKTNSGIPHISNGDIKNFNIPKHGLECQKKIAKILTTIDQLIEKTETLIDKHTAIKKGMMEDLFTRGVDLATGQLRPPVEQAPHLYKETELGWVPKEWKVGKLGCYISKIEQGWSPDCLHEVAPQGSWGVLKTTAVVWAGFSGRENKALPLNLFPRKEYEVSQGDVLMTRAGPGARVGVVAYVKSVRDKLMLSDKLYRVKGSQEISPEFLALLLSSNQIQSQLNATKTGLAESQSNISQDIVKKLNVFVPSLGEQVEVEKKLDAITMKIASIKSEIAKHKVVKKGLMQDLLTGKVAV